MLTAWEEQPNRWWWADHPLLCSCTRSSSPLSFFQTSSTCPFPLARATGIKSAPVATMVVSPLSALYHPAASLSPGHPPTVLQTRKNEDLFGKFLSSNFRSALRNDKLKKNNPTVFTIHRGVRFGGHFAAGQAQENHPHPETNQPTKRRWIIYFWLWGRRRKYIHSFDISQNIDISFYVIGIFPRRN